jgi:hypothetical protein
MCTRSQINKSLCEENQEINTILHIVFVIHSEAHFSYSFQQTISRYSAYCSLLFLFVLCRKKLMRGWTSLCVSASSITSLSLTGGAFRSKGCDVSALWKRHDVTCLGWKPCSDGIIKWAVIWHFQASVCRTPSSTVATKVYKIYLRDGINQSQ